jgi:riboflavin synthase
MFTGLVEDMGRVVQAHASTDGLRLVVTSHLAGQLTDGESIAVNGVCLTAARLGVRSFGADVVNQTLRRSTLGRLREGSTVNLELALRATSRLGGHVVQGHVDEVGTVAAVADDGAARRMTVRASPSALLALVERGSVTVDGVSLTVAALGRDAFEVSLIPTTLAHTTLGALRQGATVNVETDVLSKHVLRLAERTPSAK